MAGKLIDETILHMNTENILQSIADNVYLIEEYDDATIQAIFDTLTPEELAYYESLIQDGTVSDKRLFSSKHITELIEKVLEDSKTYTNESVAKKLTTVIATDVSEVVAENTLYLILKDADNNIYEQYMLINNAPVSLGTTTVDLSSVYTKDEVDTKLDAKIDKTSIATTLSAIPSDELVVSEKLLKDELDKVSAGSGTSINTTTSINDQSTDNEVPTAKATYDYVTSVVPTKTSQLQNDSNFLTEVIIPTVEPTTKVSGSIWLVR